MHQKQLFLLRLQNLNSKKLGGYNQDSLLYKSICGHQKKIAVYIGFLLFCQPSKPYFKQFLSFYTVLMLPLIYIYDVK